MVSPNFLFGFPIALSKICFSCIVINHAKILWYTSLFVHVDRFYATVAAVSFSSLTSGSQTSNQPGTTQPAPKLEDWLEKWEKRQKKNECKDTAGKSGHPSTYTLPPGLPPLQLLPPSLLPPPPSGYPELPRVDWG